MKTFLWKSSQRPLIRSGSEWPPYLGLGLGPTKAFPGGGTAAAPTVPWAPNLKLDANFTDKFMETKFSQEKYALLGNFHQIPPEYLNICTTFFHSFSFCGICL